MPTYATCYILLLPYATCCYLPPPSATFFYLLLSFATHRFQLPPAVAPLSPASRGDTLRTETRCPQFTPPCLCVSPPPCLCVSLCASVCVSAAPLCKHTATQKTAIVAISPDSAPPLCPSGCVGLCRPDMVCGCSDVLVRHAVVFSVLCRIATF